ncbi:DUF4856 domain-containing protein [Flavobacteriaceae bacterium Ap0902]|nr:DUF4856 domain-containing protein [Flavobacteriaceae bacterium Ap0902]
MTNFKILSLLGIGLLMTSCTSDDDTPSITVEEPSTYSFTRNGESTVNFGGQNTRILMANELIAKFGDFENATEEQLLNMYNHQKGAIDFSSTDLNNSSKNIRSKVAASKEYFADNSVESEAIKNHFAEWIGNQTNNVFPNYNNPASAGVAGQVVLGDKTRYVNEKGIENNQMFAKSLIGALMADQALNNYLSTSVLDAGDNRANNDNNVTLEGKPYTMMEHKWDEAYGYIYGGEVENEADPNASDKVHNKFLHKYSLRVDQNTNFTGIADDIFQAFKKGRAAIVAKEYSVRDEQISILRKKISTVIAVRALHYIQSGKSKIEQGTRTAAFHDLSEGVGFMYSLQFTQNPETGNPYMSAEELNNALDMVLANDGLWTVEASTLQEISELIASKFDFTLAEAAL